ncbi:hypothetical protein QA601_12540 [Chitinispirillales bacterium ANBcel5]|uniref:hypothetical protein n=1 Tax=Cellulosispirillum alkaliphilum TaxID=3039283 RepID=UPI002A565F6D|nr:hypothetical protein [Chitinispirillales bacterium ANBcel5]
MMKLRFIFLLFTGLTLVVTQSYGLTDINFRTSYSRDFLPTEIYDTELKINHQFNYRFSLLGTLQYLKYTQPEHKGVADLDANVLSVLGGIGMNVIPGIFCVDAQLGADVIPGSRTIPSGVIDLNYRSVPFTAGSDLSLSLYHTGRIVRADAILNEITNSGFTATIQKIFNGGAAAFSYGQHYLVPEESMVDTTHLSERPRGIWNPYDTQLKLETNLLQNASAYIYKKVGGLYLGYSFAWEHSNHDRYMLTGESDTLYTQEQSSQHRPGGGGPVVQALRKQSYSYYPYETPLHEIAHNIIISVPFSVSGFHITPKVEFPLYSSRRYNSYPEYLDGFNLEHSENYLKYQSSYTQRFTAPMNFDVEVKFSPWSTAEMVVEYNYFSFPYKSWGYFSDQRYYLNTVRFLINTFF